MSAYFPNADAPNVATYIKQTLVALSDHYTIDAIVPVSWLNRVFSRNIPHASSLSGIHIYYPTYYYTPFVLRSLYGHFYYYSILDIVTRLTKTKKYDLIYSPWLYPDAWVAAKVANCLDIPLYAHVLGSDVNRLKANTFLSSKSLYVADCANRIICVSNQLRDKLIELGCNPKKLVYLQNGVDHKIFYSVDKNSARNGLGLETADKVILYVGNIKKEKGLGELAHAFGNIVKSKKYSRIKLIVIGSGRYMPVFKKCLQQHGIAPFTVILGERSLEIIAQYMNACDVLCLPSYMEGQPNVVIEALTCRTKIVSTTVGGIPDLDDGLGNIKLVPPRTVEELSEALIEMLDKESCHIGQTTTHSWEQYADRLKNIFEQVPEYSMT